MPRVTLRLRETPDGPEETLNEYLCDWPDCPNVAEEVLGCITEIRAMAAVCGEHARILAERSQRST